jgi:hypothetical protein
MWIEKTDFHFSGARTTHTHSVRIDQVELGIANEQFSESSKIYIVIIRVK